MSTPVERNKRRAILALQYAEAIKEYLTMQSLDAPPEMQALSYHKACSVAGALYDALNPGYVTPPELIQ